MRRLLLPLCIACAPLAACGAEPSSAEKFKGEEAAVAQVVEDLETAGARRDAGRICSDILAAELVDALSEGGASCKSELETSLEEADDTSLEVTDVTVSGTTATAKVKGKEGDKDRLATLTFTKERGKWRATSLAAP